MARVLFICPRFPRPERIGLSMRASVSLDGLVRDHEVSVAVVRWVDEAEQWELGWAAARAERATLVGHAPDPASARSWLASPRGRDVLRAPLPDLVRRVPPAVGDEIARRFAPATFDAVVVMRSYLAGAAVPFLEAGVPGILDADDDEAQAQRSLAIIGAGDLDEAARYDAFQRTVFPWFEHVLLAARADAVGSFGHLPNAIRLPAHPTTRPRADGPLELLYVGDPGHPPNRDAVERITRHVLPDLTAEGIDARLLHPGRHDDVGPFYARAHIAVVPLRAGGGTSIKVLEAFAHGCPVVATPTGARGLEVRAGEHLVVTDDDEDVRAFTRAIADLASDEDRRVRLATNARGFVAEHHDADAVGAQLSALVTRTGRHR
ncbi:MAG: glycosyltransferase [Acidimicrobiia bacterium]|nr:glycosyltransferase [Acidimicrobiia bacterium]